MGLSLSRRRYDYDAVVVGAGPNGLAAAITMARAGRWVLLLEAKDTIGGGCRSAQLTLPGFVHDVCSAFHPLALASPFLATLPLAEHGLQWIQPPVPLAHPLDGGRAVLLHRSIEHTAAALGEDGAAYSRLIAPVVHDWHNLADAILGPIRVPRHPLALLRFGLRALLPARLLAEKVFRGEKARALFAGMAAHSMLPLEKAPCASFGLVLAALGHLVGWPLARAGSQRIADALASYLRSLGGQITTGARVRSPHDIPPTPVVLFDVTPRQLLRIAGDRLPPAYRARLRRYRHGPGVFKIDWALDGPIPWAAPECALAGTVHVGGTLPEIAAAERAVWNGEHPARPFVLVGQQSLFDPTRAPHGKQTAWAYCHVPNGSTFDMTGPIENQIERFAPGFRNRVLARHTMTAREMHMYNPNYQGGDIAGGVQDLWQLFTRPTFSPVPYRTAAKGIYICSSSTPPGGGVHGMCGYHAAKTALADGF
jgi:phytoene dehydrogenase-like protein